MKKIIAIMMALVMMMAIAVPAFAANIIGNKTTPATQSSNVDVATTFADGDVSYTIAIPASINIAWKSDATKNAGNASYEVTSNLAPSDTLSVSIAKVDDGKMYLSTDTEKTGAYLVYDILGDIATAEEFTGYNNKTASNEYTAYVSDWSQAMDTYVGTVTYTATYTAA